MIDFLFSSDSEILSELGTRFKNSRIEANLTQEELSELSGVSRTTIARLEGGKNISLTAFISLLRYVDELNGLSTFMKKDSYIDPEEEFKNQQKQKRRVKHGTES